MLVRQPSFARQGRPMRPRGVRSWTTNSSATCFYTTCGVPDLHTPAMIKTDTPLSQSDMCKVINLMDTNLLFNVSVELKFNREVVLNGWCHWADELEEDKHRKFYFRLAAIV